jgi:HK97 family phage prohead protease
MKNRRIIRNAQLRVVEEDDGTKTITLLTVRYNVLDSYRTVFLPEVFTESLNTQLPGFCWSHDWADIIGRGTEWADSSEGPIVKMRLDYFSSVPRALQAYDQVKSGTITDCSVGFSDVEWRPPTKEEEKRWPGVQEIIVRATLDEVSLVLRGAVPGAKVLALRSPSMVVPASVASEALARLAAGDIDLLEALQTVKNGAVENDEVIEGGNDEPEEVDEDGKPAGETPDTEVEEATDSTVDAIDIEEVTTDVEIAEAVAVALAH